MRITRSTSAIASACLTPSRGTSAIWIGRNVALRLIRIGFNPKMRWYAVYGMTTKSSCPRLNPPAALRRRPAGAELDVDELDRARLLLERARVGDRQIRPLDQLLELRAAGEAGDAEALDEDRVRADGADHLAQRLIEAADHRRHADD